MLYFLDGLWGWGWIWVKIHSFLGKAINQESHVQVTGVLEGISPNLSALWAGLVGFEVVGSLW